MDYDHKGTQSLANPWLKEGHRLRQKFREDRDILYLHAEKEAWEKKTAGKRAVPQTQR